MADHRLAGVFAAAVTPLTADNQPDLERLPALLSFLADRGCHGALLLGTTGEGPSFSPQERLAIYRAAAEIRQVHADFRLLAGTGTPSFSETIEITRSAFDAGVDGVVVLPPYYFRNVSDDGLFEWFSLVIKESVPDGGWLFGYHIPKVSGVPLSVDLLARLKDTFPENFAGLKDSSGDREFARQLGDRFGDDLVVLTGHDRLLSLALEAHASGCITALGNLYSPLLRAVWDAHSNNGADVSSQDHLSSARAIFERYQPAAPSIKAMLARWERFPRWAVRPPLLPLPPEREETLAVELHEAGLTLARVVL